MLTGSNGILTQAQNAKKETEEAQKEEENILGDYENYLSQYANGGYVESKGVNAPVLKDGMELVTYNEETKNWDTNNYSSAYDYLAGEGAEDNNSSKWANARVTIDGVDSYFVWIPRYAYKITYNNPSDISQGGKIDVKFLIGTSDQYYDNEGKLQTAKRATTGQEDTTSDYYVHPAFTNNVDLGGWRNELTGIWVGKYESSLIDKTNKENILTNDEETGSILLSDEENINKAIAIQEDMSSWRYCTVGNFYTNARQYAENLNSHMIKNSEWGAVAYLTHSQYGRNGNEVDKNDNENCITADGGIEINPKQSSTGNVYGIYDLSGCTSEFVAIYYNEGAASNLLRYGNSFASQGGKSIENVTTYIGENVEENYIIGDTTQETNSWNGNRANFVSYTNPFLKRGGDFEIGGSAGIFVFGSSSGIYNSNTSFRICLTI